jgi:hypothetical protein
MAKLSNLIRRSMTLLCSPMLLVAFACDADTSAAEHPASGGRTSREEGQLDGGGASASATDAVEGGAFTSGGSAGTSSSSNGTGGVSVNSANLAGAAGRCGCYPSDLACNMRCAAKGG